MRDFYQSGFKVERRIALFALIVGALLGGMSQFYKPAGSFYTLGPIASLCEALRVHILYTWTLGAVLIVTATLSVPSFAKVLSGSVGRFLGRISFALDLLHFPILGSVGAGLYLVVGQFSAIGFIVTMLAYLIVVFGLAMVFEAKVDRPAIGLSHRIQRLSFASTRSAKASAEADVHLL